MLKIWAVNYLDMSFPVDSATWCRYNFFYCVPYLEWIGQFFNLSRFIAQYECLFAGVCFSLCIFKCKIEQRSYHIFVHVIVLTNTVKCVLKTFWIKPLSMMGQTHIFTTRCLMHYDYIEGSITEKKYAPTPKLPQNSGTHTIVIDR